MLNISIHNPHHDNHSLVADEKFNAGWKGENIALNIDGYDVGIPESPTLTVYLCKRR